MERRFELIQGGVTDAESGKPELICCAVCNGTTFIEAVVGPMRIGDAVEGGDKQLVCVQCLAEGQVTTI